MYYSYQDLRTTKTIIKSSLIRRATLYSIYKDLRSNSKWSAVGDYPLLCFLIQEARVHGRKIVLKDVLKVMRKAEDKEFVKVRLDSEILKQICA